MMKYLHLNLIGSLAKILIAVSIMVLSIAAFIGSINQAMAADLQTNVTVTGENITLGDIYNGLTENQDFVLAPAPEPGTTTVWNARTLKRLSKAFDLPQPQSTDQVSIRRLANIITSDMLKKAIIASFKDSDENGHYDLEFLNKKAARIILPHHVEPSIEVVESSYNSSRQTFSATLKTKDGGTHHVTGVTYPLIQIPMLKLSTRRGDTIGRNDVVMVSVREDFVTDDMVVRQDKLVGMTPRKIIRAKTPVNITDLAKPVMVKRGELVTMQLKRGPIKLSSLAKALEAGTEGDIIRLMNIDSKRTIEAEITGLRTATVLF